MSDRKQCIRKQQCVTVPPRENLQGTDRALDVPVDIDDGSSWWRGKTSSRKKGRIAPSSNSNDRGCSIGRSQGTHGC